MTVEELKKELDKFRPEAEVEVRVMVHDAHRNQNYAEHLSIERVAQNAFQDMVLLPKQDEPL